MLRRLLVAAFSLIVSAPSPECPSRIIAPVRGTITDYFRPPTCTWCAGNRGWEISVRDPYEVVSATAGVVSFAGRVGGVAYLVIDTGCGLRITYGRLDAPVPLRAGAAVRIGQVLARSQRLFLGVRRGSQRIDPAELWGRRTARLVPPPGKLSGFGRFGPGMVPTRALSVA